MGRGKQIPRLPLSAFSAPDSGTSDTFPLPPTPSLVSPSGVVDAHLHSDSGSLLDRASSRAVVVYPTHASSADSIARSTPPVLAVLAPFALDAAHIPVHPGLALTATCLGLSAIAPDTEEDARDHPQVETPVSNLRWALSHARAIDLDIHSAAIDADPSSYDNLVNLLTKAIKPDTSSRPAPVVFTDLLPPPLDSFTPVVAMMNHPTYTAYRHRVSLLSLFENIHAKLLPPSWIPAQSENQKEFRDSLKLFIVPVLEAFGFDRIIFGSSPPSARGSPALAECWYKLVLGSLRELAVSQDEMDKIFMNNAERVYGST